MRELKNVDVIIRNNSNIRSRQWWTNHGNTIKNELIKHLPKSKKKTVKACSLTLLISNDKEIQDLNREFRKKNKSTDVLSFHIDKKLQYKKKYLGDIIISQETAKKQAKKKKVSLNKELLLLFIHGYLHLLGYDHIEQNERKIMFSIQDKILEKTCK